jgi:hypothetical protein
MSLDVSPAFKSVLITSGFWAAAYIGAVPPLLSRSFTSAPAFKRTAITSGLTLFLAAHIRGVLRASSFSSRAFTSAPLLIATCTLCGVPVFAIPKISKMFAVCAYAEAANRASAHVVKAEDYTMKIAQRREGRHRMGHVPYALPLLFQRMEHGRWRSALLSERGAIMGIEACRSRAV